MIFRDTAVALILLNFGALASPTSASNEQPISSSLSEMFAAANAHDADRFMKAYENSDSLEITFDDLTMHGWKAIRDQQAVWWENGKSKAIYSETALPIVTAISSNVYTTVQKITVSNPADNGPASTLKLTILSVWKKLPEGWRIVVAHESFSH